VQVVSSCGYRKGGSQTVGRRLEVLDNASAYTAVFAIGEVARHNQNGMLHLEDIACDAANDASH